MTSTGLTGNGLTINPSDREKLRRFVDKGGILWIDYTYGFLDQSQGGPVPFRTVFPAFATSVSQADYKNPLLRYPNTLSPAEISVLAFGPQYGAEPTSLRNMASSDLATEGATAVAPLMYNVIGNGGEYGKLQFVTGSGTNVPPSTAYAKIGDGYAIITTRGVSEGLNRVGNNTNREYYAVDPTGQTGGNSASSFNANAVAKFVINAISLSVQSTQSGSGSRKNYSAFIDTGAPLLQTWASPYSTSLGTSTLSSLSTNFRPPVIYKGMTFSVSDDQVFCHDGNPKSDIDRNGNADDGVQDFNLGKEQDLIFATAPIGTPISSAVCVEVPNPAAGVPSDQLLVTTSDGRLLIYPIFDPVTRLCSASETLAPFASLNPGLGGSASLPPGEFPKAPTVQEGIAYVVDTVNSAGSFIGRVWQANLQTLQVVRSNSPSNNAFVFGGTGNAIQRISSSPTVGYIPILDNSGGLDKVMYLPLAAQTTSSIANSGLMSVWVGAKGERPSSVAEAGGIVVVTTRAATQGGLPIYMSSASDPLAVHVSLVRKTDGSVYTAAEMSALFSGGISESQGTLSLTLAPLAVWPPADVDPDNGLRIDYTIDWGQAFPVSIGSVERGRLQFATPTGLLQRNVVDGIALSPSGTIYVTSSTQLGTFTPQTPSMVNNRSGSFYALKEEGRGIFRMVYRWDLYPEHTFSYSGGIQSMPAALPDNDPVQNLTLPGGGNIGQFIGGPLLCTSFQGAPVVRNGDIYVTVNGYKRPPGPFPFASPCTALLCFKDDSSAREIRLGRNVSQQAVIVQPDFARSTDSRNPTTFSALTPGSFRIEKEPGDVGSTIRIDNMMNTQRGQILDSINTSQPIILREQGRPDTIIDPAQQNDRWSPLKWFSIFHGMSSESSAFCSGSTVFVSGGSYVPSAMSGNFPPVSDGFVTALRTDFDPNVAQKASQAHVPYDANPANFVPVNVVADDNRPYMKQVISMDYLRTGPGWASTNVDFSNLFPNQLSAWPQVPQNKAELGRTSFEDYQIRLNQCVLRGGASGFRSTSRGVVGGDGLLLAWNTNGIFCFRRASTWVADEGRILQLDPSGNTLFDSSLQSITGASGGNTSGANLTKFDRPTRVYPLSDSGDVLVVDSNQNRVLRMSAGGAVGRNLTEFSLDRTFVPAGYKSSDPLTFSNPRDAATYVSEVVAANNPFFGAKPLESWRHYIVADQGNNRLIEVVDRFEEDSVTGNIISRVSEGTLLWHSPPAISGKGYSYNSLTRIQTGSGKFIIVAGIGGKAPSRIDSGEPNLSSTLIGDQNPNDLKSSSTGNGGIVIFDSNLQGGYRVFNQFNTPGVDHTRIWDFNAGPQNWSLNATMDVAPRAHFMSNLQSVTASLVPPTVPGGPPQLALMIADATGVYEVVTNSVDPITLDTRWMLPNWAFRTTRRVGAGGAPTSSNPIGFFPTYARRLDEDNIMIVNGFTGKTIDLSTDYSGEVLQLDGRIDPVIGLQPTGYISQGFTVNAVGLGFSTRSIKLRFGPVEGSRGLFLPVFADRR